MAGECPERDPECMEKFRNDDARKPTPSKAKQGEDLAAAGMGACAIGCSVLGALLILAIIIGAVRKLLLFLWG